MMAFGDTYGATVKRTVQDNLFDGFAESFSNFGSVVLPQLQTGMGAISKSLGEGLSAQLEALGSTLDGDVLDGIFQQIAQGATNANAGINPLTQAMGHPHRRRVQADAAARRRSGRCVRTVRCVHPVGR